jgi:hypothetical protein
VTDNNFSYLVSRGKICKRTTPGVVRTSDLAHLQGALIGVVSQGKPWTMLSSPSGARITTQLICSLLPANGLQARGRRVAGLKGHGSIARALARL